MLRGCTGCEKMLPLEAFSKHAKKRDGLQPRCKSCVKYAYDSYVQSGVIPRHKRCSRCKKRKSSTEFSPHKGRSDGLQSRCKSCRTDLELARRQTGAIRVYQINRLYGLSSTGYAALLDMQGGTCAICRQVYAAEKLCIDHDHATGKIRGILCNPCNTGLGFFKDNPDRLHSALDYLAANRVADQD